MTSARPRTRREVVEGPAIGRGTAVAIAICLPLALVSEQAADEGEGSPLSGLLLLLVLAGFAVGGFVAGRSAAAAPFTNGGLAAVLAYVAIQGTALVVGVGDGDTPSIPALVFNGLLAYGCGLAGGALAARRSAGQTVGPPPEEQGP